MADIPLGNKKIIALIPARSGSTRIEHKNIKLFNGLPLLAWTILAAKKSGIFGEIWVSSDSRDYLNIAEKFGAKAVLRPFPISDNLSADIDWVLHALTILNKHCVAADYKYFSILRPTSPFRTAETIQRAYKEFLYDADDIDSLRAIEKCKQHPYKMWYLTKNKKDRMIIEPFCNESKINNFHSMPYQSLPSVYQQNASLEIAHVKTVYNTGTIAGSIVKPFFTNPDNFEGFDINTSLDWLMAEYLIEKKLVKLPWVCLGSAGDCE